MTENILKTQLHEHDADRNPDGNRYVETVKNVRLARAYVPFQIFEKILPPEKGFKAGTVFPSLCGY